MGEVSLQRPVLIRLWCGSLGLEPNRAAEGAAGPAEGHGGDAAVTAGRYTPGAGEGGYKAADPNLRPHLIPCRYQWVD